MPRIRTLTSFVTLIMILVLLSSCNTNGSIKKEERGNVTSEVNKDEINDKKLTIDDIKKKYTDSKILNVYSINDKFVLIESQRESFANIFELYNLENGDKDYMPSNSEFLSLQEIVDENTFVFLSSGKSSETSIGAFPYLIKCIRVKNDINSSDDFIGISEKKYFKLNESVSSGSKDCSILSDIVVTLDGIQVLFEPIPGNEVAFYAAESDIPITTINYSDKSNEIFVEIESSEINNSLIENIIDTEKNTYIDSIKAEKDNSSIRIVLKINPDVEKYRIRKKRTSNGVFFELSF